MASITTVKVKIFNIDVSNYFMSFKYKIRFNGKVKYAGTFSSEHQYTSLKHLCKKLKNGYGAKLALEAALMNY